MAILGVLIDDIEAVVFGSNSHHAFHCLVVDIYALLDIAHA
jgi:hypothetical protein